MFIILFYMRRSFFMFFCEQKLFYLQPEEIIFLSLVNKKSFNRNQYNTNFPDKIEELTHCRHRWAYPRHWHLGR